MEETDFQKRIARLSRAETIAREILDVPSGVSAEALHDAWRRACKRYHPDQAAEEEADGEKFHLARLAYRCLRRGEDCEKLLRKCDAANLPDADSGDNPDNRWAYFLSWRDRFF